MQYSWKLKIAGYVYRKPAASPVTHSKIAVPSGSEHPLWCILPHYAWQHNKVTGRTLIIGMTSYIYIYDCHLNLHLESLITKASLHVHITNSFMYVVSSNKYFSLIKSSIYYMEDENLVCIWVTSKTKFSKDKSWFCFLNHVLRCLDSIIVTGFLETWFETWFWKNSLSFAKSILDGVIQSPNASLWNKILTSKINNH